MLQRIQKNLPQLIATLALALAAYCVVGMVIPSADQNPHVQPLAEVVQADQVNNESAPSSQPASVAPNRSSDLQAVAQPDDQSESPQHPDSDRQTHQFTEQEKIAFASLPPMCRPPEMSAAPVQFSALPTMVEVETAGLDPVQQAAYAIAGTVEQQRLQAEHAHANHAHTNHAQAGRSRSAFDAAPASLGGGHFAVAPQEIQLAGFDTDDQSSPPVARQASMHSSSGPTNNPPSDPDLKTKPGEDPHQTIYSRTPFPSAKDCAQCHKQIYEEWATSSHAYASISPMFHVFEDTINKLSQGTIGYFCYRCHAPVSTTMGLRRDQAIWDGPRVFREGVTCVACHRVKTPYGKADGERRIEPGDIYDPVYGGGDGRGVAIAEKYSNEFKVKTKRSDDKRPGQAMHRRAIQFEELSKSTFCMSCHQVAVEPGIKLEVVWDQYRASPAYRDGVTCQDCHMGIVPGMAEGYSVGPGAVVNNKVINAERKHSNHVFYGPGYSIAHPGVFPDNLEADRWTVPEWLEFDWRAGWGTDHFEDALDDGQIQWTFPKVWEEADDRYDAREIVDANLKKLEYKRDLRRQLLENGSKLDGPFFLKTPQVGQDLNFRFCLTNLNTGHNMPSGSLGAQPQLWLNAVMIDPNGNRVWETGYLDSNGDLADNHSLDVLARKVPLDTQLMNLQTKFLTTNAKGTDREMYLPVNFDFDQLPFLRPPQQPVSVQNHPPFIRMEGHSIPPLGKRNAKFAVPARLMQTPGTYRISVRMRSRAEPIYFMRFCNATPEMQRMMNEWICDFHATTVTFEVH